MLRQMYEDLRTALDTEIQLRAKSEDDLRAYFDQKSEMISTIQSRGEQGTLEREKGIMTQVHTAMQQVATLVKEMRDQ